MNFMGFYFFIFLFLLSTGIFSYLYLVWNNYWNRVSKYSNKSNAWYFDLKKGGKKSSEVEYDEETKLKIFEKEVISKLKNSYTEYGVKIIKGDYVNKYDVRYKARNTSDFEKNRTSTDILCDLKRKVHVKFIRPGNPFFRTQNLDQYLSKAPVFPNRPYNTCAVVSNAGAMLKSGLGDFIDSHDFVIRFNDGRTTNYEKDVGTKTSLRIVNSQIVAYPRFEFLEPDNIYSLTRTIVWDISKYKYDIAKWYAQPDHPFFGPFFSKRLMKPSEALHLLEPTSLWSLWNWLQSQNKLPLLPNPPTSGFLGLFFALQNCIQVRMFEYIPSIRYSSKCHYFGKDIDGKECTYGAWHPVSSEKLIVLAMSKGTRKEIYHKGYVTIPGFYSIRCPNRQKKFKNKRFNN